MPPAYKRQHYLPAAYLKYFSIDQAKCVRDSWIWRFDGQTKRLVRVDSQCARNYHYSKEDAASTEKMFQKNEDRYCSCLDKIRNGHSLTDQDLGDLLSNMFDFYIRNAIHKNDTGKEGIEAYRRCAGIFWSQILLRNPGEFTKRDVQNHISRYWGLKIVEAPSGRVFITSDNPSVWTSISKSRPGLHLLSLPITPTRVAVAFDSRFVLLVSDQMSEDDYLTLMDSQMYSAASCLYSSIEFTEEMMSVMKEKFLTKDTLDCRVDETSWTLALAGLPPEHYFSFMQLRPPLM